MKARYSFRNLMLSFSVLALVSVLAFTLSSCRDKNAIDGVGGNTGTTIEGVVTNVDGAPIAGVIVRSGSDSVVTDGAGHYKLYNGQIDQKRAVASFEKEGFFAVTNTTLQQEQGGSVVNAVLMQRVLLGSFDNAAGGSVTSADGLTLTFAPNGFKKADGTTYSGKIRIYGANIDATHNRFGEMMPGGDFSAQDPDNPGKLGILESVGAFYVDAAGGIGNKSAGSGKGDKTIQSDSIVPVVPNEPFNVCVTLSQTLIDIINQNSVSSLRIWRRGATAWQMIPLIIPITVSGNQVCTQFTNLGGCNFDYLLFGAEIKGKVCRPDGSPAAFVPVQINQLVTTTNAEGKFVIYAPSGPKRWLHTPFGSRLVGPILAGRFYNLQDSLCSTLGDVYGKVFFTTSYDNVVCGDSNTYPMDPNRWIPTGTSFVGGNVELRSASRACPGVDTKILYAGNALAVGTYYIPSGGRFDKYMQTTINGKVFSTNPTNGFMRPATLGGSFTISSYSERFGYPAIALGSYQFTGGYYNNSTRQWETKQFRGNFRFQMQ